MTENNPDPLEVARGHVLKNVQRLYVGGEFHGFGAACACGHCFNGHADEASVMEAWAVHTAAIIAQHYAPVIAENEQLRQLASHASQAFDTYVQQVNDRDPSEAEAAYSSAFAALRNELDKALGAKP